MRPKENPNHLNSSASLCLSNGGMSLESLVKRRNHVNNSLLPPLHASTCREPELIDDFKIRNQESVSNTLAFHNYELRELIGSGGFAHVFRVFNARYNQEFALKIFDLVDNNSIPIAETFANEIESLKRLNHPNIIRIYDFFEDVNYLYLVLEYCPNGTLKQLITEKQKLTYSEIYTIMTQVLSALEYCHSQNISHSDIKPSNVLFDTYGRVKLADFGLSIINKKCVTKFSGSKPFMAPEIIAKKPYNPMKADIWALGVMMFYMVTGNLPWNCDINSPDIDNAIIMCRYQIPFSIDSNVRKIISKAMVLVPNNRLSIQQIFKLMKPPQRSDDTVIDKRRALRNRKRRESVNLSILKKSIASPSTSRITTILTKT